MKKIGNLTRGERLTIARRRAGKSQKECADDYFVTLYTYRRWELDLNDPPETAVGELKRFEKCLILRRRAGVPAKVVADRLRITQFWLSQIERGAAPDQRLVEYWEKGRATAKLTAGQKRARAAAIA